MKPKVPAYVLGGGVNGLGVMRNLGRNGVPVYPVLEKPEQVIYSKFCEKSCIIPGIENNTSILRKFFLDARKRKKGGVIFPTTDLYSLHLSELRDDLKNYYHILLPAAEIVKTLVEKERFYHSLSEQKIPHPKTIFPTSIEDVKEELTALKYPVLIKPSISQIFWKQFGRKVFTANSAQDLLKYYDFAHKYEIAVVIQEIIPGPDSNIYGIAGYFDAHHYPRALFAYHRLRGWPPIFGTSSLMESISLSKLAPMKETISKYLHQLGYHGIMEAEFKKDPRDGIAKLIEVNARSWWQNTLPTACGINIVLMAYLDVTGEKINQIDHYAEGIKWINLLNDIGSMIKTRKSITKWISSLKNIRDWSFFAADDTLPWIISTLETASDLFNRRRGSVLSKLSESDT